MNAGILGMLPMANNPVEREWFVVRVAARPIPQVALAFEQFLRDKGQAEILKQFKPRPGAAASAQASARSAPG
jgi:hypothetical protein